MRKFYLLCIGVTCLNLIGYSQNTLFRNNYFTIGNQYPVYRISNLNSDTVIISGSNTQWNFSDATFDVLDTVTALEPSETVFYNQPDVNYNTTELCLYSTDNFLYIEDNMFSYFHSNDESIEFAGEWADNPTWEYYYYHFQDPEQYFAFPFNYEDSFTDQFLSTAYDMSGSGQHKGWGTRTVVADGFGTLIMPDKTYSNCLRLKATINYSDSSGLWGVEHYTKYQYTWFALIRFT